MCSSVRTICCLIFLTLTFGCAGVQVTEAGGEAGGLKGIPFRIKEPVWVQETKIAETGWTVTLEVQDDDNAAASIPTTIGLFIPCATAIQASSIAEMGKTAADGSSNVKEAVRHISAYLATLKLPDPSSACQAVVSNKLLQESRVSDSKYFITHIIPLFGSGTGAYELNGDGTLSKASTTITDDTAKTLLSLFPIKEKLLKKWNLAPAADAAKMSQIKPKKLTIDATLTPRVTVYTLKKDLPSGTNNAASPTITPLTLVEGKAGTNGVQLVSTTRSGEEDAPAPNPKAYKIEGAIIPPNESE